MVTMERVFRGSSSSCDQTLPKSTSSFNSANFGANSPRASRPAVCLTGAGKAVDPACKAAFCPVRHKVVVLGGSGHEIDVGEAIIAGIEPVGAIQQGFHLAAHLVVINRRGEGDDVGIVHFPGDLRRIVLNDAASQLLAGQTPPAELDLLTPERHFFRMMPGIRRAPEICVRQRFGIAVGSQTGGNNQYILHKSKPPVC